MQSLKQPATWRCGRFLFELGQRRANRQPPLVMGILNATPDSFSDGGRFYAKDDAVRQAEAMIAAGVDLIDIGGESTKPGAIPVSLQEELDRVLPIIESIKDCGVALSIDTYKAETMRQALLAGVDCVNDIWALRQAGAEQVVLDAALAGNCGIVLMHMQCDPITMQLNPNYENVVSEVNTFLLERTSALTQQGVAADRIAIDPGFGFGKSLEHNLKMLQEFSKFTQNGYPVLAGISRKSMLGKITGREVGDRLVPSVTAAVLAAGRGASIVRVHDVPETIDALTLWAAAQAA
jgi:dihydropteroate synthase